MIALSVLMAWILQYRYVMMFPIMIVEGPIITVIGGFLASTGVMDIQTVYALSVCGDLVGDVLFYSLGRFARLSVIERFGHYAGITAKRVTALETYFDRSGIQTLIGMKFTQFGMPILIAAGASRMSFAKFAFINLVGSVFKSLVFVAIGYYFGSMYVQIDAYMMDSSIILIAFIVAGFFVWRFFVKNNKKKGNPMHEEK